MDPNETFRDYINAISNNDKAKAFDCLCDLRSWISRGGFPPRFPGHMVVVPSEFIENMYSIFLEEVEF